MFSRYLTLLCLLSFTTAAFAQRVASYYFNDNLLEYTTRFPPLEMVGKKGEFISEVVPRMGKLPRQVYRFHESSGLKFLYDKVPNFPKGTYTTEMYFRYDNANLLLNKELITKRHTDEQYVHLVLTRDAATRRVHMYLDGELVVKFVDSNDDLVLVPGSELVFFTRNGEATTSGAVAMIKIYDLFIDEQQVPTYFAPFMVNPKAATPTANWQPPKVGTMKLSRLYFQQSQAELLPESLPQLEELLQFMQQNAAVRIRLLGYTDNQGDFKLNVELSKQRVEMVKNYLVGNGIDASRIEVKGYGSMNPVASNKDENSRRLNRRVELEILE